MLDLPTCVWLPGCAVWAHAGRAYDHCRAAGGGQETDDSQRSTDAVVCRCLPADVSPRSVTPPRRTPVSYAQCTYCCISSVDAACYYFGKLHCFTVQHCVWNYALTLQIVHKAKIALTHPRTIDVKTEVERQRWCHCLVFDSFSFRKPWSLFHKIESLSKENDVIKFKVWYCQIVNCKVLISKGVLFVATWFFSVNKASKIEEER
jgi:hypothetical protein